MGVDISGVDILGVDILGRTPFMHGDGLLHAHGTVGISLSSLSSSAEKCFLESERWSSLID